MPSHVAFHKNPFGDRSLLYARAHTKKALCNNAREKDDDENDFFLSFFLSPSVCLSVCLSVRLVCRETTTQKSNWKKVNARRKREI